MTDIITIAIVIMAMALVAAGMFFVWKRRPRELKTERFELRWKAIQKLCGSRDTWPQAVVDADVLLDEALKKRHIAGKNMGERMVHAQRLFTDNDSVWFGHKLRNKIEADSKLKLKEDDVKGALLGIRRALKDLGALPK